MVEILDASSYSSVVGFAIIVVSLCGLAYLLEDRTRDGAPPAPSAAPASAAPEAADEAAVIAAITAAVAEYRNANP